MDVPGRIDDLLAQPTRARLFGLLTELGRPVGTEELAERVGLHPNGVRVHLERLRDAGLIGRDRSRQPRGRPRDLWLIAPDAQPGGRPPQGYAQLGRWLTRLISSGPSSLRKVEATGRQIGRELAPDGDAAAETKMNATLRSLGFQPRREAHQPGVLTYRLCNCPYREAVRENAAVVCALHRGLTRGLLDELDPAGRLVDFVARDPTLGDCVIDLRGELAAQGLQRLSALRSSEGA
jgi:predicted ArsR family transcriptional regulator